MQFRTELNLNKSPFDINFTNKILLLGSCFSDNIGMKLTERKFNVSTNPFGTVYNAVSIQNILASVCHKKLLSKQELDVYQNIFSHPNFHSKFNNIDSNLVLDNINAQINNISEKLKGFDLTFITLGTSWVYERKDTETIVSNCHKQPQHLFEKKLLSLEENKRAMINIIELLHAHNSNNKIVFTISPVRHIKDGIVENQVSKAILIQAVYELCKTHTCSYFPSYEIMMDDLRDYRYYKEDMIHPSDQAVDYIWEKFHNHYFTDKTKSIVEKIEKINTFLLHRPSYIDESYLKYKKSVDEMIEELKKKVGVEI
jgi:hypothetical protein